MSYAVEYLTCPAPHMYLGGVDKHGPWAKSVLSPVSVNKVLLGDNQARSFILVAASPLQMAELAEQMTAEA